jgi:hypothetical protein
MANDTFRILGRVIDQHRKSVPGLRVEAWDKERIRKELAAHADTDKDGQFKIELDEPHVRQLFGDRRPDVFFQLYHGRKLIKSTENSISRKVSFGDTRVLIQVELEAAELAAPEAPAVVEPQVEAVAAAAPIPFPVPRRANLPLGADQAALPPRPTNQILHALPGRVLHAQTGSPLAGLQVRAFDLDDGSEPRHLGTDRTSGRGLFTVALTLPKGQAPAGRRLRLVVLGPALDELLRRELEVGEPLELRISPPVAARRVAAPRRAAACGAALSAAVAALVSGPARDPHARRRAERWRARAPAGAAAGGRLRAGAHARSARQPGARHRRRGAQRRPDRRGL